MVICTVFSEENQHGKNVLLKTTAAIADFLCVSATAFSKSDESLEILLNTAVFYSETSASGQVPFISLCCF